MADTRGQAPSRDSSSPSALESNYAIKRTPAVVNEVLLSPVIDLNSRPAGSFGEAEVRETRISVKWIKRHLHQFKGRSESDR